MRYILDSSVALKWVLPEVDSAKANALRNEFRSGIHELLVPDVWSIEVAHALTKAERMNKVSQGEAIQLLADLFTTLPAIRSAMPLLKRAVEISSAARIAVYDCLYVALAEREQCELLTADDRLARNLPASPIRLLRTL